MKSISVSRQYAPLRVCAEMCLYYYVLALLSLSVAYNVSTERGVVGVVTNLVAPWSAQLSLLVGLCFALGFLIVRVEHGALRFLLSLLPGLSFLLCRPEPTVLILAAAWVYYVICMTAGNFETYLDVYRRRARLLLFVALLLTCCLIVFRFGNEAWYGSRLLGGELFGLLFFVLTVFSLRGMRLSFGAPASLRLIDAAHIAALPVVLIGVFFLLRAAVPVFNWIFARFVRVLIWLYRLFFHEEDEALPFIPDEDFNAPVAEDHLEILYTQGQEQSPEPISGTAVQVHVSHEAWLWVLAALLAAALVWFAIRQIRGRRKERERPRLARERIEKVPPEKPVRRRAAESALPANVRQIRRAYGSYLEYIRSLNIKTAPSDASEDVLKRTSARLDLPENAALRELYIAARYGDGNAVTAEQAAEAKRCLTAIREKG